MIPTDRDTLRLENKRDNLLPRGLLAFTNKPGA
jgi:hypothetical protein